MKKDFRYFRAEVSAIALCGALGLMSGTSEAAEEFASCPDVTSGDERTSAVRDLVAGSPGAFQYRYRVCNTSDPAYNPISLLRDWELPFNGSGSDQTIVSNVANITNIVTPEGWTWSIEKRDVANAATGWDGVIAWQNPADPFFNPVYANHEYVLHFYTDCFEGEGCNSPIGEGEFLDGFGFDSPIGPAAAPYQASWFEQPPRTGDPLFPLQGGIPDTFRTPIPEPGSLGLLAGGLGALLLAARRRRQKSDEGAS